MNDRALDWAAEAVGDRWVLLVVSALRDGPRRFSELAESVPGVAPNVLTERLRRMERVGLVATAPYSQRPRRLTYALTALGEDLARLLPAVATWAARHGHGGEPGRHEVCGTPVEAVLWCPTCALPVDAEEGAVHNL